MRRVRPGERANAVAAGQVAAFAAGPAAGDPLALFVFDAGYDPMHLAQGITAAPATTPVCLRAGS